MSLPLEKIQSWIDWADALVINAGAGMGVDSGLPDYRGTGGQWGSVESETEKSVFEVVNPKNFIDNPSYAWNFFLERMKLYEQTQPHQGFYILLDWVQKYGWDYFILTSNIDGHFQKAGFDDQKVRELHGSLNQFQSEQPKKYGEVWENEIPIAELEEMVTKGNYPTCPNTTIPSRPNVYMFRDNTYIKTHSNEQEERFQSFLATNKDKNILVFEIGSGPHVQSIRMKTRMLIKEHQARVIRINPKEFKIREPHIGVAATALNALQEINSYLEK